MSDTALDFIKVVLGVLGGGGLGYLASRGRTKADTKVALAKVGADHETAVRSVAIEELEAACKRLAEENKELRTDASRDRERIDALEAEHLRLRESEQECRRDLAFIHGKLAVLEGAKPVVTVTTGMQDAGGKPA